MTHSQIVSVGNKSLTQLNSLNGFVSMPARASVPINDSAVDVVDSVASGPVAVQVLQSFGIPVFNPGVLNSYANLPGYDIYNQDCFSVMQLSLATQFLDNNIVECYIDENGMARFIFVGADVFDQIDSIRYSVPTTRKNTPVDAVFVRGLKPAVRRELREAIEGMPDSEIIDWTECKRAVTCDDKNYANFASIMYVNPILSSTYYHTLFFSSSLSSPPLSS